MTRDDTVIILGILKTAYPNFYKDMKKDEMYNTIDLWNEMFEMDDVNLVKVAVKEYIQTGTFPPSIAEIKNKIYKLTNRETTPAELWNCLQKALKNGIYGSEEEFEKLPAEVKAFVKNPAQLKEMAQMNSDVVNSVTKGQFFKQIEVIQARIKEDKQMLPEARKVRELALGVGQDVNRMLDENREHIPRLD